MLTSQGPQTSELLLAIQLPFQFKLLQPLLLNGI